MKPEIQSLLQELYQVDAQLKNHEEKIVSIITKMIEAKPNIEINETFKTSLKQEIKEYITHQKVTNYSSSSKPNLWNILSYIFGWAWVAAFSFFIIWWWTLNAPTSNTQTDQIALTDSDSLIAFENTITPIQGNFGSLANLLAGETWWKWWGGDWLDQAMAFEEIPSPMSIKMQTENTTDDKTVSTSRNFDMEREVLVNETAVDMIMPFPDGEYPIWIPEIYRYNFSWEFDLEIPEQMSVYKKVSSWIDNQFDIQKILSGMKIPAIDMWKFSNLWVSHITLDENKPFWHSISISLDTPSVSIYSNWKQWPQEMYNENKPSTIIWEDELINIAQRFLQEKSISTSPYGQPKIDSYYNNIINTYATTKILPQYHISNASVVFPVIVDENEVQEEYGWYHGLTVEIDLNEKKVSAVYGLSKYDFQEAKYDVENNTQNILKVAQVGGRWGFYDASEVYGQDAKYIDIEITSPKLTYINNYKYDETNFSDEQYLIPAVVFEVVKNGSNDYYGDSITIPLIKDLYTYDKDGNIIWNSQE